MRFDDNGDGKGTPVDRLRDATVQHPERDVAREIHFGATAAERLAPEAKLERAKVEAAIAQLRKRKGAMEENEYYEELEKLMLRMAGVYGMKR